MLSGDDGIRAEHYIFYEFFNQIVIVDMSFELVAGSSHEDGQKIPKTSNDKNIVDVVDVLFADNVGDENLGFRVRAYSLKRVMS